MAEYFEYGWTTSLSKTPVMLPDKNTSPDKKQAVQAVRSMMSTRQDIVFPRSDDDFLLRFLHARKCNVQASFELLVSYHLYRQRNEPIFLNLSGNDPLIRQALCDGFPGVLPDRDRKGRCVLVMFTANWDHTCYPLVTIYRALLLSLERLVQISRNQVNGFIVIVDWSEFSFRQSSNLNPRVLRLMIEGLQDCFPARFKGIHFINQPWYVEAALTVIRPFLKEKTKEKIFLHGNNLSTLHDLVPTDILPAELGGEAPCYNPHTWADQLLGSSQEIVDTEKAFREPCCDPIRKSETFSISAISKEETEVGNRVIEAKSLSEL